MSDKKELINFGLKMVSDCLVKANWGNLSIRTPGGFIISPSGIDYEKIVLEDIVEVNLDGEVIGGFRKPSSELPLHQEIYKNFPKIHAVVHTHSIYASAFAVCHKNIPPIIEDMVQIAGGEIRVAKYALPGTKELGENVIEALQGRNACLLANHGLVGIGRTIEEAYKVCLIVEKSAQIASVSKSIGDTVTLSQEDINIMREYYLNSYGQK